MTLMRRYCTSVHFRDAMRRGQDSLQPFTYLLAMLSVFRIYVQRVDGTGARTGVARGHAQLNIRYLQSTDSKVSYEAISYLSFNLIEGTTKLRSTSTPYL